MLSAQGGRSSCLQLLSHKMGEEFGDPLGMLCVFVLAACVNYISHVIPL